MQPAIANPGMSEPSRSNEERNDRSFSEALVSLINLGCIPDIDFQEYTHDFVIGKECSFGLFAAEERPDSELKFSDKTLFSNTNSDEEMNEKEPLKLQSPQRSVLDIDLNL